MCILLLFALGGLVRVTESGMGCPDWPTCYGSLIPPSSESDLPANYKEAFRDQRVKKVKRMVKTLRAFGMNKKANEIEQNKDILVAHDFSFRTMVTEYTNRLFGALTGVYAFLALISSFQFVKKSTRRFVLIVLGIVFVGFNGWLGSVVVDTNLLDGVVTAHFILAFLALSFFMLAYNYGRKTEVETTLSLSKLKAVSTILFTGIVLQIIGGTTIREMVDAIVRTGNEITSALLIQASFEYTSFMVHKLFPAALLVLMLGLLIFIRRKDKSFNTKWLIALIVVFFVQGLSGSLNLLTGNSTASQLIHVAAGGAVFALALQWLIQIYRTRKIA